MISTYNTNINTLTVCQEVVGVDGGSHNKLKDFLTGEIFINICIILHGSILKLYPSLLHGKPWPLKLENLLHWILVSMRGSAKCDKKKTSNNRSTVVKLSW